MIDKIVMACIALFLPLGLIIANRLLDRTALKEKDKTIETLTNKVASLLKSNAVSEKKEKASDVAISLAQSQSDNRVNHEVMMNDAKGVQNLEDALALANKQVESNR